MLPRISYLFKITDIYTMKDSVYIEDREKDYNNTATIKKNPVVVVLIISVVGIVLLNLINTVIFL